MAVPSGARDQLQEPIMFAFIKDLFGFYLKLDKRELSVDIGHAWPVTAASVFALIKWVL